MEGKRRQETFMKASVGDRITVHGLHVGDSTRRGEVTEVKGADWGTPLCGAVGDGHEALFVPGSGVRIDPVGKKARKKRD